MWKLLARGERRDSERLEIASRKLLALGEGKIALDLDSYSGKLLSQILPL